MKSLLEGATGLNKPSFWLDIDRDSLVMKRYGQTSEVFAQTVIHEISAFAC